MLYCHLGYYRHKLIVLVDGVILLKCVCTMYTVAVQNCVPILNVLPFIVVGCTVCVLRLVWCRVGGGLLIP